MVQCMILAIEPIGNIEDKFVNLEKSLVALSEYVAMMD